MSLPKKQKIIKFFKFLFPPILWAGIIFTFSSLPTIKTTEFYLWDFIFKKTAHFVEYGILSTLIYRGLINYNVEKRKSIIFSILISAFYAITDEIHQSFVPGRGPAVRDVIIDILGAWLLPFFIRKTKIKILNSFKKSLEIY